MNKLLLFLTCNLLIYNISSAQIIINEISYNPPEFGNDKLEYIELYNTSPINISLKDFFIVDAVEIVFPDTFISGFGYFVICNNQAYFDSIFKFKALQWTNGALRNDSEIITLLRPDTTVMDSIRYFDTNGWPKLPDGSGPSLELCRNGVNKNQPTYWRSSITGTGIIVEGFEIKGSPGVANNVPCGDVVVEVSNFKYSPADITINVGEQVEWLNKGGGHNVNGTIAVFPQNPDEFTSGPISTAAWSYIKKFDVAGQYQYRCDAHPTQMTGKILVKVADTEYPFYPISKVKSVKPNGVLDSLGVKCQLDGIVYGINFRPAGLQFTLIDDAGDGIAIFSASGNKSYTVKEGDRISARGVVSQFNGLAQLTVDSIILLSSGNVLKSAKQVATLDESTESTLIKIRDVSLVNPSQWSNSPLGFTVRVTNGILNFDVRIDNDCELVNKEAPSGKFDLTGIGSQNDNSEPYTEGYQIWPRYLSDIDPYVPVSKFYNRYDINKMKAVNTSGVGDSIGVRCELVGIVYGVDLNGTSGLQFTLIDNTGGIAVFSNNLNFNYQVLEGDRVAVQGKIDQFRGLLQIIPDTLWKLNSGNALKQARLVTGLDESSESDLVRMNNLTLVNRADWIGNGLSFNVRLTDGVNEFIMRIDDNTDLANTIPSSTRISVTGLGSQFDGTSPYTSDYQIMPRYKADIDFLSSLLDDSSNNRIIISPNPSNGRIQITGDTESINDIKLFDLSGHEIIEQNLKSTFEVELPEGIYLLKLNYNDGYNSHHRVVIQSH